VIPPINPRRPLDPEHPNGYTESDKDFVLNNLTACVWFLNHALSFKAIKKNAEQRESEAEIPDYSG
jgi:hypothetical protein